VAQPPPDARLPPVLRDPRQPAQAEPEVAAADVDEGDQPPKINNRIWQKVTNLEYITQLNLIKGYDGWRILKALPSANGPDQALVAFNCRQMRSPEPRWDKALYRLRSTFGMFPAHTHMLTAIGGKLKIKKIQLSWCICHTQCQS
jgi:hypothetical protein